MFKRNREPNAMEPTTQETTPTRATFPGIDLDAMMEQINAFQSAARDVEKQIWEARQQRVLERIESMPDGFWLARARDVLARMADDPEIGRQYFGNSHPGNIRHQLDDFIRWLDQREQNKGKTP